MSIQTRKLNIIEHLLSLEDESILSKIEHFFRGVGKKSRSSKLQPMSLEEFLTRHQISERDKKAGRMVSHGDVKKRFAK